MKMKTIIFCLATLFALTASEEDNSRSKRGYHQSFPVDNNQLSIGGVDPNSYGYGYFDAFSIDHPSSGIPIQVDLTKSNVLPRPIATNSLDKPVQEPQDPAPPQNGPAVIPLLPPPATPVNAAASNVPNNGGAVFLGSGSLGVIELGGGAYALGSGGLGYSDNRRLPRPSGNAPLYPPLPAAPNLIPAAVPNYQAPNIAFPADDVQFDRPLFDPNQPQPKLVDQNGYEYLAPNQVRFGMMDPRLRRVKATPAYATPTFEQIDTQFAMPGQRAMPGFGMPIPQVPVAPPTPNLQQMPRGHQIVYGQYQG